MTMKMTMSTRAVKSLNIQKLASQQCLCRVIDWYDGLMGVDVTHLLKRRWSSSFLVVSKTQCSNRSNTGASKMLKQTVHPGGD